jgi:hypothetical protein
VELAAVEESTKARCLELAVAVVVGGAVCAGMLWLLSVL